MKTYLVKLTIFTGSYEKHTHHLVADTDPVEAGRQAMRDESHDPEDLEFENDTEATDLFGGFVYRVYSITEVEFADIPTLRKYL